MNERDWALAPPEMLEKTAQAAALRAAYGREYDRTMAGRMSALSFALWRLWVRLWAPLLALTAPPGPPVAPKPESCLWPVYFPHGQPGHALTVGYALTPFHAQAAQRWVKGTRAVQQAHGLS